MLKTTTFKTHQHQLFKTHQHQLISQHFTTLPRLCDFPRYSSHHVLINSDCTRFTRIFKEVITLATEVLQITEALLCNETSHVIANELNTSRRFTGHFTFWISLSQSPHTAYTHRTQGVIYREYLHVLK